MTGVLRQWARRYWIILVGYVLAQTIFSVEIYRIGKEIAARETSASASSQCDERIAKVQAVLEDCSESVRDLSASLTRATDGLTECATTKPCCTVRVETP